MESVETKPIEVKTELHGTSIAKLARALVAARKGFKTVVKDSTNPAYKSKYASLAAYIEATSEELAVNGLHVVQRTLMIGNELYLETMILHESGETFHAGLYPIRPVQNTPQGFGSAITYARRYCLAAALNLASEDDDASDASQPAKKKGENLAKQQPEPESTGPVEVAPPADRLTNDQRDAIMAAAKNKWGGKDGMTLKRVSTHLDRIAKGFGATNLTTLTMEHVGGVLDAISSGSDPA